mmetsp:Transcript_34466/g.65617  ORF Transcript_34466/g.65617 Transcript_34466/m.65617 type:complete len:253 (-) Transcript_34466:349-1107(-)
MPLLFSFLCSWLTQKSLLHPTTLTRKGLLTILFPLLLFHQIVSHLFSIGNPCLFGVHLLFDCIVACLFRRTFVIFRLFLFSDSSMLCHLLGFSLFFFLFKHVVVLHGLSPYNLTPTRLNLVRFCPDLLHLCAHHRFRSLITLPLLDTTHTLRIQLVHPCTLPLYVAHDGNVSNTALHQRLCQLAMVPTGLSALCDLAGFPPVRFAFALHVIIFIHGRRQLEVEFVAIKIGKEVVYFGILSFFCAFGGRGRAQ